MKSIIIDDNLLNICLFGHMTLFTKASYTIITPKQFVLVCKRLSFRVVETIPTRPKQIVLLLKKWHLFLVLLISKLLNCHHKTCHIGL